MFTGIVSTLTLCSWVIGCRTASAQSGPTAFRAGEAKNGRPEADVTAGATAASVLGNKGGGGGAVLGLRQKNGGQFLSGTFNFANKQTISGKQDAFGSALLNPGSETLSFNLRSTWDRTNESKLSHGVYTRLSVAAVDFTGDVTRNDKTASETFNATVIAPAVGYRVVGPTSGATDHKFRFIGEIGLTGRFLAGDVVQDEAFRQQVIGTTKKNFLSL